MECGKLIIGNSILKDINAGLWDKDLLRKDFPSTEKGINYAHKKH